MRRFRCHRTTSESNQLFPIVEKRNCCLPFIYIYKVPALKTLTKQRKPRMSLLYETRLMRLYCKLSAQHNMNYLSYLCVCVCVCVSSERLSKSGWRKALTERCGISPRARSTVRVVSSQHTAIIRTAAGPLQSHTLTALSKTPSVSSNTCHLLYAWLPFL